MAKRIAGLVCALLLLLCASALAEEPQWTYDSGNMYLKPNGPLSGDVTIPAEVDGYEVNALELNASGGQDGITSLTMPDTLRALKNGAICWMDSLTAVTLNDGLEYIGNNFFNCNALTSLTIPSSVRIVDRAFSSCANLKEIRFEGACPLFIGGDWCFSMMPADYTIYVPDDQLSAYAAALKDANDAAEHLQPSGKNAVIPEKGSNEDWFVFDAATGTITGYREYHAYVEIPAAIGGVAVKAIGPEAFRSDYSIYGVVFPEGLERIEAGAFKHASNIAYMSFPTTLKTIGDEAFNNAQALRIDWSEGLEEIGARAFQYDMETILTLPGTVRTIGESAFEDAWCQELYLSGSLESIGSRAFAQTALDYLVFDFYTPIDIAPDAFVETYVADLDLPWDSTEENRRAYEALLRDQCPDCTVWINNPESAGVAECPVNQADVTTITGGVWTAYHGSQADLTVWTVYDDISVTALGDGVFKGNQTIRSFYPHHCGWFTTIGAEAFADSSVSYVEMFGSITTIGDEAFRNCANITALALPESLTSIGAGAFRNCTGITELTLPASLTYIGEGALDGCDHLARLTVLCDPAILPDSLLDQCYARTEIYAAPNATREQVARLSAVAHRPWYAPVSRVGEPARDLTEMPYATLPGEDFWYDGEYARLDAYQGYELNLVLPREIDGVQLTMIGGGMMNRASRGDNFDVELPVRSLVIPETFTTIPAYAFSGCETLETVICYAPVESLEDNVFAGCTSLRQVIFVNGVRQIGRYVFDGCTSLETVYLGSFTDAISEYAFLNEDGSEAFSQAACITDPSLMPDVDALLDAVRSDPMPEPEPEPEPEPAQPVGDAGAPFLGTWHGVSMEMEGMAISFSYLDMVMDITFYADGTVTVFDGEETDTGVWRVESGVAILQDAQVTLQDDGSLWLMEDGDKMVFTRDDTAADTAPGEATGETTGEALSEGMSAYAGIWHACYLVTGGVTGDPRSLFGLDITLTLNEDGTGVLTFPEAETHRWYQDADSGVVYFGDGGDAPDMPLALLEGGFLRYGNACGDGNALGGYIIFSQDAGAVWMAEPAGLPSPDAQPSAAAQPPAVSSAVDIQLERKYICTSADVSGFTMDAAMLGGEYSVIFHEDGSMDFVLAGTAIPGLTWTQGTVQTDAGDAPAVLVDYFGTPLTALWTAEGFDLNYLDSMLMHFVPET